MSTSPYLGEIMIVGFNFPPIGWMDCDGNLLPISTNNALFALLGTMYGGDGRTTFALPDLRGRIAMHAGDGPTTSNRNQGTTGGSETATLTVNQIPAHSHGLAVQTGQGNQRSPVGNVLAGEPANVTAPYSDQAPNGAMASGAVQNTGGTQAHSIMNPFQVVRYCIAITGVFPSRS